MALAHTHLMLCTLFLEHIQKLKHSKEDLQYQFVWTERKKVAEVELSLSMKTDILLNQIVFTERCE